MAEEIDWSLTTFEGNRQRQLEEFRALSFREKLLRIEEMGEVCEHFARRREAERRGRDQTGKSGSAGQG